MLPPMKRALAAGLGWVLIACTGGTETGNPVVSGSLSYTGYSSASDRIGVGEGGEVATVMQAWFALDSVSISKEGCDSGRGRDFEVAALGLGDHAAGAHVSTEYEAEAGTFCRVELPFVAVADDANAGPEELRGHSLLLTGKLADGTELTIVSDARPVVELEAEAGGFELQSGLADALVAFDFATWLDGVDFDSAEREGDAVVISADSNPELLQAFDANLAAGIVLYRDADADGVLDDQPEELARVR
jgi:hypothetical protein